MWRHGAGWPGEHLDGAGQADRFVGGDRGPPRRLPRAASRDAQPGPGRHLRAGGAGGRAAVVGGDAGDPGRGLASAGPTTSSPGPWRPWGGQPGSGWGSPSGSPSGAGSGAARPTPPRCCAGPAATTWTWPHRWGPTSPSAWWAGGRWSRGSASGSRHCPSSEREFLLCLPPFGVDTARVYAAWDEQPDTAEPNALTAAALRVEPRLAQWRDALGALTGQLPVLAGSGSTWFVEGGLERGGLTELRAPSGLSLLGVSAAWCGLGRCPESGWGGAEAGSYLPARRCQRVAFSIFLCFFLRMRLRRFLISDPMSCGRLAVRSSDCQVGER